MATKIIVKKKKEEEGVKRPPLKRTELEEEATKVTSLDEKKRGPKKEKSAEKPKKEKPVEKSAEEKPAETEIEFPKSFDVGNSKFNRIKFDGSYKALQELLVSNPYRVFLLAEEGKETFSLFQLIYCNNKGKVVLVDKTDDKDSSFCEGTLTKNCEFKQGKWSYGISLYLRK